MTTRKGDWIQTFTGKAFWPLDPRPEEVDIFDIAHALSNICRYTGHVRRFYSVAEHSVLVSRLVPQEHAKWGLLHDASEAYIADIARPVKRHLTEYAAIEKRLMLAIAERFDLPWPEPPEVKYVDNRILHDEKDQLFGKHAPRSWDLPEGPFGVEIDGWTPQWAKTFFLKKWEVVQ